MGTGIPNTGNDTGVTSTHNILVRERQRQTNRQSKRLDILSRSREIEEIGTVTHIYAEQYNNRGKEKVMHTEQDRKRKNRQREGIGMISS